MPQWILPHILFGMSNPMFSGKPFQQRRKRERPVDSSGEKPRKLIEQPIRVGAGAGKLHVVAVLQKVQNSLISISLSSDRKELVSRRALRRVNAKRILGPAHVVDVHGELCRAALEILMKQALEVIEEINIRSTVNLLIKTVWVIERRRGLRTRVA